MMSSKRNRRAVQDNKATKQNKYPQEDVKDTINSAPLKGMNPAQQQYISYCRNNSVVIATGYAGTSKTYIPTRVAIEKLRAGHIDKIVIVRPNISDSKSLGFFSGDLVEKVKNWIRPVLDIFHEFVGQSETEYLIKMGKIDCVPLEIIKGMSFKRSFIIVDEAEDLNKKEFIKCVTRVGEGSTIVFAGDILQQDVKGESGLALASDMAKNCPRLKWGYVNFNRPTDIVRSSMVREVILELTERGLM